MATLAGLKCPYCLVHGVTSHLGSNGVCGRCWRKAEEASTPDVGSEDVLSRAIAFLRSLELDGHGAAYEQGDCIVELESLRATLASRAAGDALRHVEARWQPIDTAPKHDGLLSDGKTVSEGGWLSQLDQGAEYEGQSCAPSAGWWSCAAIENPTHWMPLPSPPEAK